MYADREYTEAIESKRQKLRPILRRAKQLPKYKMKSKLEGGKLIIKGKSYTSKCLHLLPDQLTSYRVSSKENGKSIGFFGELSLFSNFHEASFELDGIVFHSSEQYIQYQKARLFNDIQHQQQILASRSVLECKQMAREIHNFDPTE